MELMCPSCKLPILETYYYCPNCGKQVKKRPPSTGIGKLIGFFLVCIFLTPFGLIPSLRYLSQEDEKSKIVGGAGLILTVISLILIVVYSIQFINQVQTSLAQQEKMYQNLGL
ncbi:MAG: hypothetical protein ACM3IJ_02780 [Candidatus Levyibacteriota bacterium]